MTIAACLSWYDEPVEFLDRCVRSLAGVADMLVALDGRWEHMPGENRSPVCQRDAIWKTAGDVGLDAVVSVPDDLPFASQVAKRNALVSLAFASGADWLLVIDGDEYVQWTTPGFRALLERTDLDAAAVTVNSVLHNGTPLENLPRRLLRAGADLEYVGAHNAIRNDSGWLVLPMKYDDGDWAPAEDATRHLAIFHDRRNRGRARNHAQQSYYQARSRLRFEKGPSLSRKAVV